MRSACVGDTVAAVQRPPALRADHAVARILAVTDDEGSLYPRVLEAVGEALSWSFGALWVASPGRESLVCVESWTADGFDSAGFEQTTRALRMKDGVGLPGRVWITGEPAWIVDLPGAENFPRAEAAAAAGLGTAFAFPISSHGATLGVMEFFSAESRQADEELLATMASLGSQIGQFVVRRRAERAVHDSDQRKRAILDAALDCVVTVDHTGAVLEFNQAAERTFGYTPEQAIGADMADLIVPPSLRAQHRAAFSRYVETEEAHVLGQRLELTAMRADESEFPVELTITRIDLPGPPKFTGYIRDISELKLVAAELRASRARLVAAADVERRRLERDLHDGAQQRLVNVGLTLRLARSKLASDQAAAQSLVDDAIAELAAATVELREFARGIHPAVLSDGGLGPALQTLIERSHGDVELVESIDERLPASVEATAYFIVAEALTNVARHSGAEHAEVRASRRDGHLIVAVRDDGQGGADAGDGSGLRGLADRVAALGGELEVVSPAGGGTVVEARIPCA